MAYLSDIDLATLHKKRLEEKNHYKLSWYNRRFYDDEMSREQRSSLKLEEHKVKPKVTAVANIMQTTTISKGKTSLTSKQTRVDNNNVENFAAKGKSSARTIVNYNRSLNVYDEGYFSSPTLNRRRSGTWP
jgi:hypothetical protein